MERKIGEIFERNGELYRCVKSIDGSCRNCDMNFGCKCPIPIKECTESGRSDKTYVIFKKLEKVGGLTTIHGRLVQKIKNPDGLGCLNCCFCHKAACELTMTETDIYGCGEGTIYIEIKQNQEDMEEKKDAVFSNLESTGKKLKPFDLEKAKSGKPVCTRAGNKVRIICFDRKDEDNQYPIVALIQEDGRESVSIFSEDGHAAPNGIETPIDLMMLPEKHEGWVNIYKGGGTYYSKYIYKTEKEAISQADTLNTNYVATVKIEWEE